MSSRDYYSSSRSRKRSRSRSNSRERHHYERRSGSRRDRDHYYEPSGSGRGGEYQGRSTDQYRSGKDGYYERPDAKRYRDRRDEQYSKRDQPSRSRGGGFRFDSPPKEEELTKPGLMQALQSINNITSQEGSGNIYTSIQAMAKAQSDKIDRKLYVGNIPPGITQQMLLNIMNEAILSLGIIKEPGNPILSAWISSDSHYAFVEFRNADEANKGLKKLQGMNISGCEIKLGRPKSYESTMQQIGLAASLTSMQTPATLSGIRGSLPE
jgi:splicing factor U2AF 65 kDa subunit